jgi:hypothetical protein
MSTPKKSAIEHKVVDVKRGDKPKEVTIKSGGSVEFKNVDPDCDEFELVFEYAPELDKNDKLTGTKAEPIFIHMPEVKTVFVFYIVYKCKGTIYKEHPLRMSIRNCGGCD